MMDCAFWWRFIFIHVTSCVDNGIKLTFVAYLNIVLTLAQAWSRTLNQFQQREMQKTDSWSYQYELQKTSQHWISYLNKNKYPLSTVNHRTFSSRQIQAICMHNAHQTSCRRAAATLCSLWLRPSSHVGVKALCAAEQTATWQQFPTANTFSLPPLQPLDAPTRLCVSAVFAVNG